MAKYEKYPPDMKGIPPISLRHLLGGLAVIVAAFFGYFEYWGDFGLCLTLSIIIFLGVYIENWYRRIARRLDRLEDMIREIRPQRED